MSNVVYSDVKLPRASFEAVLGHIRFLSKEPGAKATELAYPAMCVHIRSSLSYLMDQLGPCAREAPSAALQRAMCGDVLTPALHVMYWRPEAVDVSRARDHLSKLAAASAFLSPLVACMQLMCKGLNLPHFDAEALMGRWKEWFDLQSQLGVTAYLPAGGNPAAGKGLFRYQPHLHDRDAFVAVGRHISGLSVPGALEKLVHPGDERCQAMSACLSGLGAQFRKAIVQDPALEPRLNDDGMFSFHVIWSAIYVSFGPEETGAGEQILGYDPIRDGPAVDEPLSPRVPDDWEIRYEERRARANRFLSSLMTCLSIVHNKRALPMFHVRALLFNWKVWFLVHTHYYPYRMFDTA